MLCVLLLVIAGTTVLVRCAPGYLSDAREMDARYSSAAREDLSTEESRSGSLPHALLTEFEELACGHLGASRQFGVPVSELILPRLATTGSLLLRATLIAWTFSVAAAIISNSHRSSSLIWHVPATVLLAIPIAAMATICLLMDHGGPLLVMTLLLAARDFKFVDSILRKAWHDQHLLQARAQGLEPRRLWLAHVLPGVAPQLVALASFSIATALSALVPVEVIFNIPGIGQLAWNAALNRDLPVLLAVTLMMAIAITSTGMVAEARKWGVE